MSDMTYDPKVHDTSWHRQLKNRVHKRGQRGSNKPLTGFRIRNRFRAPATYKDKKTGRIIQPPAAWIRLIPGNYTSFDGSTVPYYDYVEHFCARVRRGFICGKTYSEKPNGELDSTGDCICCYETDENGAKDISWRQMTAFLMVWLDEFYLVPATNNEGVHLTYQQDSKFHKKGDPIMDRILAEDLESDVGNRRIKREGYEKVFGKLMHFSLGNKHIQTLTAKQEDLSCYCTCGGSISKPLWECANCEAVVIDLTEAEGRDLWGKRRLAETTQNPYACKKCGVVDMLHPVLDCNKCNDPKPLQLWDVDIEVSRQGENTNSQLIINNYQINPPSEEVKELIPQRDLLHRVFAPDSNEDMAKTLRVRNVFKDTETRHNVEDYDKRDQNRGDDHDPTGNEDPIPY